MSEIIEKNNTEETKEKTVEKTFTQEEVNRIISDRLARERSQKATELDEREKAVKARELAVIAAEKLAEAGLPKGLSTVLKYDDEASLEAAINQLSSLRGFKTGKEEKFKPFVIENKLPEDKNYEKITNPIRDAFKFSEE